MRRDQEEQAKKRLRDLIQEGLASGPGHRRTKADDKRLLAIARGEDHLDVVRLLGERQDIAAILAEEA
jgi:hypothetical protein